MVLNKHHIAGLIFMSVCNIFSSGTGNVEVVVQGIRSPKGQIVIGVYRDEEQFRKDKPELIKKFEKTEMLEGTLTVRFSLEPGTYGFSLLDDENRDGDMNYNLIGLPKEGFGFSDYMHSTLTRPRFDAFKFKLKEGEVQRIVMKVKYMIGGK